MASQLPTYGGGPATSLGYMVPLILSMADSLKAMQEAQTAQAKALQQIAAALTQQSSASKAEGVKS